MSDQALALPVRTEGDPDQRIQSKIVDFTNPSVGQIVDSDGNSHVEAHGNDPAGVDRALLLTEEGRSTSRGDYDATTNTKPSSSAMIVHGRTASPTEANQTVRPTGVNSSVDTGVWAQDVAIRDESGNPYSASNPLPTTSVDSEGEEINDFDMATAVAGAATSNHDYTVTAATTLKLTGVRATASGRMKIQVQIEDGVGSNTFDTVAVSFNSVATPDMIINFRESIEVAAGVRVRVIRSNRDMLAMDLYSTISGHEIAD